MIARQAIIDLLKLIGLALSFAAAVIFCLACSIGFIRAEPGDKYDISIRQNSASLANKSSGSRKSLPDLAVSGGRPSECPRRYCGCGLSLKLFGKVIPPLNLAANWLRLFPRTEPAPGMVAARRGHVMMILAHVEGRNYLVFDPNSGGGLTREHVRSIAGFGVVNPHARMAAR